MKQCTLCAQDIPLKARKCFHCDGYQGSLIFLNLSVPVLSLLLALVSILSIAMPALFGFFTEPRSDIGVSFQFFKEGEAHMIVTNAGERPGTVSEAYFDYGEEKERYRLVLQNESQFIEPGQSKLIRFGIPCEDNDVAWVQYAENARWSERPLASTDRLTVVAVEFDGKKTSHPFEIGKISGAQTFAERQMDCLLSRLLGTEDANHP